MFMKENIKILAFDSWTGGIVHYSRLVNPLSRINSKLILIHIGSWGVEPMCPKEQIISDILIRDISWYQKNKLESILDYEKPDLVLFLSTQTFAHRAFIRYCKLKQIPTVHLTHGIFTTMFFESGKYYNYNFFSYSKFILVRVKKIILKVWPTYIRALIKTKATLKDYFSSLEIIGIF